MNPNFKAFLHILVNLGGNTAIFDLVPQEQRPYAFLVFNLLQVVYAFFDKSYAIHVLGKKQDKTEPLA